MSANPALERGSSGLAGWYILTNRLRLVLAKNAGLPKTTTLGFSGFRNADQTASSSRALFAGARRTSMLPTLRHNTEVHRRDAAKENRVTARPICARENLAAPAGAGSACWEPGAASLCRGSK